MVAVVIPLGEQALWRSHNSLQDHILAEYHAYTPAVTQRLLRAKSLIHVSFDNWTTTGGKSALTGICVHHLNESGEVDDCLLGLPVLHGKHSVDNIAEVVSKTLQALEIN
ncbi:hAT family dimerization domain protein [Paraphaeosphaeria sporulosa]